MELSDELRQGLLCCHLGTDGFVVWLSSGSVFYILDWGPGMNIFVLLNVVGAWLLWKWAQGHFENNNNFMGWTMIFFSAWNAAAAANTIL